MHEKSGEWSVEEVFVVGDLAIEALRAVGSQTIQGHLSTRVGIDHILKLIRIGDVVVANLVQVASSWGDVVLVLVVAVIKLQSVTRSIIASKEMRVTNLPIKPLPLWARGPPTPGGGVPPIDQAIRSPESIKAPSTAKKAERSVPIPTTFIVASMYWATVAYPERGRKPLYRVSKRSFYVNNAKPLTGWRKHSGRDKHLEGHWVLALAEAGQHCLTHVFSGVSYPFMA